MEDPDSFVLPESEPGWVMQLFLIGRVCMPLCGPSLFWLSGGYLGALGFP
jgi:hypothetical protein